MYIKRSNKAVIVIYKDWDLIDWFNPDTYVCLSQTRT